MNRIERDDQTRFVWPPSQPQDAPSSPALPTPVRVRVAQKQIGGPWHAIEAAWLGSASVALGHRGNWTPEPLDAACSRCGRSVGVGEVSPDDGRCPGCRPERLRWERLIRLGEFEGDLRQAIVETKYSAWRRQGTLLGRLLGERIARNLRSASIDPGEAALVPAPMPWLRRMRRGIDHATVIARAAASSSNCRVAPVLRRRQGPTQTAVAPSARAKNIRGQISIARRLAPDINVLILIDDVRTTGATLDACCRALTTERDAPPRIWAAVAAVVAEPDRRRAASRGGEAGSGGI
ncbi:MAG: hypothetical protein AAGJ54_08285 [Planctomycetota bacterium]